MALNARLRAVADFVCGGALVVDVGCDHAILPVELVKENRVKTLDLSQKMPGNQPPDACTL